jgi:hypothetical protein
MTCSWPDLNVGIPSIRSFASVLPRARPVSILVKRRGPSEPGRQWRSSARSPAARCAPPYVAACEQVSLGPAADSCFSRTGDVKIVRTRCAKTNPQSILNRGKSLPERTIPPTYAGDNVNVRFVRAESSIMTVHASLSTFSPKIGVVKRPIVLTCCHRLRDVVTWPVVPCPTPRAHRYPERSQGVASHDRGR